MGDTSVDVCFFYLCFFLYVTVNILVLFSLNGGLGKIFQEEEGGGKKSWTNFNGGRGGVCDPG